jgi:hypothetical protein
VLSDIFAVFNIRCGEKGRTIDDRSEPHLGTAFYRRTRDSRGATGISAARSSLESALQLLSGCKTDLGLS